MDIFYCHASRGRGKKSNGTVCKEVACSILIPSMHKEKQLSLHSVYLDRTIPKTDTIRSDPQFNS